MIRATTPTHALRFDPGVLDEAVQIVVSYKQDQLKRDIVWAGYDTKVIQVDTDNDQILVGWTQEKTAEFRADRNVEVQVRIFNRDSEVGATQIIPQNVFRVLNDQLMGGEFESTEDYEWIYDEPNLSPAELNKYYDVISEFYGDLIKLYLKLGLETPEGEDAVTWDFKLADVEVEAIAEKLGLEYEPGWDVEVPSGEAATLRRKLNITGIEV